jgi:ribonuclease P protein component
VLKEGKRRRSGGVVMVQCPGVPGVSRVGLVVSRSAGNAVTRNRVKRRLRHSLGALQLRPGIDYVFIGDSQVAEVPHSQLMGWLERVLEASDV